MSNFIAQYTVKDVTANQFGVENEATVAKECVLIYLSCK